nr:unnamed protein product [Spirometra erinaceieuropaei]
MRRNLRAGVLSLHRCSVFGHSRLGLSSGFSNVGALSATAPDPINDSRRFQPWKRVFRLHHQTPDGCLRSVCNSNPKWCQEAANSFRNVLDVRKRPPRFGVRAVRPFVPFVYAPVDKVACVPLQDCHAKLRKYRQRIDQEKTRCCEFIGEIGTNLLLQRIAEQAREQIMIRDAVLVNKFRKLPNAMSPRNDKLVHNLSSKELTKDQMQVLRHEASFNTADVKPVNMIAAVESILCQTEATEETKSLIRHQVSSLLITHRPREVLSKVERDALRELKADKDLVIVPADKGRSTVVLDRKDYLQKAKGLLKDRQFYVPCATNPLKALTREINATLLAMENSSAITPTDRRMGRPQNTALARISGLPKVHKDGAPLRPIVSLKGTPTYGLVKWLIRRLKFLTAESDTTVSLSAQSLEKLKEVSLHQNEVMVSFDVTSPFTSIPQDLAIETIELLLQSKYDEWENHLGCAQILQLLMLCLRTYFTFDGKIYKQVKGTLMRSPISGFIAEAVLQRLESLVFQHHRP